MDIPKNERDNEERINTWNDNGWVFPWLVKTPILRAGKKKR